jgi:pyridoxal phosphate enzyme (YggS family)
MAAYNDLGSNVARIRSDINNSLKRSGGAGGNVVLVAVTKTLPPEAVEAAVRVGITDVGENRVQETVSKKPEVTTDCRWHLIGHLQKNKISKAIQLYDMIQSIDSYELAAAIDARAEKPVDILLQVDSSGEETKFGISPDDLTMIAERIARLEKLRIRGLMTIGPMTDDRQRIRHSFRATKSLFDRLNDARIPNCSMEFLSMGMSGDYMIAVEEGSNMVRIGTALFGKRG